MAEKQLRMNTYSLTDRKPRQAEPTVWWQGPGHWAFLLMVRSLLISTARQRGWEANQVEYIRVANLEGDPRIWFWPTDENDPDRIPLRPYRGRLTANLSTVMINWKMALPSGQRNRYDVRQDENGESPVGPALYINRDKVLDTKWTKKGPAKKTEP